MFTIALALNGVLFGLLTALLGWLGNKVYSKLESIERQLVEMETELRRDMQFIDRRVTRLESFIEAKNHE